MDWSNSVLMWSAVAGLATCGLLVVTAFYTHFTLRLWRSQTEAKVIAYVKHDLERPTMLMIVIENIGKDIARDVKFTSSKPIPVDAYGIAVAPPKEPIKYMEAGPLVKGIPALGPGDCRTLNWGQYGGLTAVLANEPIELKYTYLSGVRRLEGESILEVESYWNTNAAEKPNSLIARRLEKIAGSMERIARSVSSIQEELRPKESDETNKAA